MVAIRKELRKITKLYESEPRVVLVSNKSEFGEVLLTGQKYVYIPLKHTYKILPHVATYVTPFSSSIYTKVLNISNRHVELEITYNSGLPREPVLHYAAIGAAILGAKAELV